jgi:penicillin-binding protein 2
MMRFRFKKKQSFEFDEILLDASNLPSFNTARLEGRRELPVSPKNLLLIGVFFVVVATLFIIEIYGLQIVNGAEMRQISDNNRVNRDVVIAERGVVYDRTGEMVVWNELDFSGKYDFPIRAYTERLGMGQLIGYVSYPQRDRQGFYYRTEYIGRTGIESAFNTLLSGVNGRRIEERNARGEVVGKHVVEPTVPGAPLQLSVDAELSEAMYQIISTSTAQAGFRSGAAAIMDIHTGEIIALTSFPSYKPQIMADGKDIETIEAYNNDPQFPFLNKVVSGVYTPGSVMKPFVAYGVLAENIFNPNSTIVSTGQLIVPNRFNPSQPGIFRDWRAHGVMNMRQAIAFSSNVYFYITGGGYGDQKGLGITKMYEYYRLFGFGSTTGITIASEQTGIVPNPLWKREVFDDDWRLGDTYFTSIGQYGFLTTPLQVLRGYAALANGSYLVTPHVLLGEQGEKVPLQLNREHLRVVQEGMRMAVNYPGGTARSLERQDVAIAAKSGTAEIGANNAYVNSWAAGYWPYENPKYAFVLMMDKAPRSNALGATRIMGDVVEWIAEHRPEYLLLHNDE